MRTVGNILWLLFAGIWLALGYALAALINLVFIVTIPFAIASWRLAGYALWPFGRVVVTNPRAGAASTIGNIVWFFVSGLWLAIWHVIAGMFLCLTVIGIPFGVASFKMARLALAPLGKQVVRRDQVVNLELVVLVGPVALGE